MYNDFKLKKNRNEIFFCSKTGIKNALTYLSPFSMVLGRSSQKQLESVGHQHEILINGLSSVYSADLPNSRAVH